MAATITAKEGVCGGKPCITGHGVRVSDVVIWHEHQGLSADDIVSQVPGLTLADVHAALAYYYENIEAIREEMRSELAAADQYESNAGSVLRPKLDRAKRVS